MSDIHQFNRETKAEREARRERAQLINAGHRGPDGLTTGERALLDELRRAGYELKHGYVRDEKRGSAWYHLRITEPQI